MAATSTAHAKAPHVQGKHVHHGRTAAAWVGTIATSVAFIVGAIGLMLPNWTIFWAAVALVAVGLIGTVVLRKMGYGAD